MVDQIMEEHGEDGGSSHRGSVLGQDANREIKVDEVRDSESFRLPSVGSEERDR